MRQQVGNFVRKNFQTTQPYIGVNLIRKKLITHSAMVVFREDNNEYLGVLTPLDIAQRQNNLVIDCLVKKHMLQYDDSVINALETMYKQNADVLPLEKQNKFEGLIFKNDLIAYLSSQNIKQQEQIQQDDIEIKKSEKILNAIYNSTHSVRFLIAPDYSILFFNKAANKKALLLNKKALKIGDNFTDFYKDLLYNQPNFKNDFKKALKGKYVISENEISHLDKSLWIKTEYYPVYTDKKSLIGISISSRDISDRKRDEIFIMKQSKALKDIIFFQSHEVRRPVASILGILQLIDTSQLTPNNKTAIELLTKTTHELDSIIRQIIETADFWTNRENNKLK